MTPATPAAPAAASALRRLSGAGRAALPAAVLVLVAAAGLAAAPGDGAPWAAYAQSPALTVQIGALMTNADGQEFNDPARIAAVQYAVDRFNAQSADLQLDLVLTVIERGQEPARLVEAYGGGSGPLFYIGPTTSEGLTNLIDNTTSSALLDNVVLVSPSSEAPSLALDDNIFRLAVNVVRQGDLLVREMESAGIGSYVAVYRNDSWGRQLESAAGAAASQTGIDRLAAIPFGANMTVADWTGIAGQIEAHASGPQKIGVFFMGYDDTYDGMSAAANASAALRQNTAWFATSGSFNGTTHEQIAGGAVRDFSAAIGLTALREDVPDNAIKAAVNANLTGEGIAMPGFYEYSAYDSVFILGNAIRMASGAGGGAISAAAVSDAMPLAAMGYARAALGGDILLDANGDLRAPDRFTVRTINSTGHWVDGSATYTPVTTIGALVGLGYEHYPDDMTLDALRQAATDYNAGGQTSLVKLVAYNITEDIAREDTRAALVRAHDGGAGPSAYVGPTLSESLRPMMGYADDNGVVLFSPASEAQTLAIPGDNTFRMAVSSDKHGSFMGQVMAGAGIGAAVAVVLDDEWGRSLNASLAAELASRGVAAGAGVPFSPDGSQNDWAAIVSDVAAAIRGQASAGPVGVALVGTHDDQNLLAAAALGSPDNATLRGVQWFVTPSGVVQGELDRNPSARAFATATNMTGIVNGVGDSDRRTALDSRVQGLSFYEYAAYDTLFVLGDAIKSNIEAGLENNAASLKAAIPAAAEAHVGVLGDIALNSKGDLLTPDRFVVRQVNATGSWEDTGATVSTPVADIGAIVVLESASFDDSPRLAAMRLAVDDYNRAAEDAGPLYLNLVVVRTSLSPGAATATSPAALDAVTRASADGGISYYVGPSTSGNSKRVLEYANENNLTLISPSSTAPSLAIADDALFRLVPNDSQQGKVLADIVHNQQGAILAGLIDQGGHEHVIMVVRNDTWGQGLNASTSQRLGVHEVDITRVIHDESDTDWSMTAMAVDRSIAGVRADAPGDPIAVLQIGFPGDFVALAAQAAAYPSMSSVPWFGTDGVAGTAALIRNDTARLFADAVNLTATKFDVANNTKFDAVAGALESRGVPVRTIYEYSAYDSIFVMGRAVESAMAAKGSSHTALDVRSSVRAAAAEYEGALGDIELGRAGDLRTPNSYAAWEVRDGAWEKIETHPPTPVFDIGALLMLDGNPVYTDDLELAAMRVAVDDFNTEHELVGDFYVNLAVQRISISPDAISPDPDALAGLTAAYDGGDGPSYYIGPSTSGNTERVLSYANDNGIVLISHSSTAPSLAVPGDSLFRMVVPDGLQGDVLGNLIDEEEAVTHLVMAVRNDTWGRGVDEKTAAFMGDDVDVTRVWFAEAGEDWAAFAARLNASVAAASAAADLRLGGAAGVLFIGFDGDFVSMAAQAAPYPVLDDVKWFGPDGIGNSATITANATALEFANATDMRTVVYSVATNDVNERLDPRAVYGPSAYDAVYVMGNAIKDAYGGSGEAPPGTAVRDAVPGAALAYAGALGNVTLDANGDLASPSTYAIYHMSDSGMWTLVHTVDAADVARVDCSDESIRCITITELHVVEFAGLTTTVHYAHEIAVEDYNREQNEAGGEPRIHLELERVPMSFTDPVGPLAAEYDGGAGPSAYLGPSTSYVAQQLSPYVDANGIVLVTLASSSDRQLAKPDTMFRVSLNDRYEADLLMIAAEREGVTTVIPVVRNDSYGLSYASEARIEGDLLGMAVLDAIIMQPDEPDQSALARDLNATVSAAIEGAGGDPSKVGLLVAGFPDDMHNLAHHAIGYPDLLDVLWFDPGTLSPPIPLEDPETLRLAQSVSLFSTQWETPQDDELDRIHDIFLAEFDREPDHFAYAAYDSVFLLADAINRSMPADSDYDEGRFHETDAADVAASLPPAARDLDRILGDNFDFDANGDRVSPSTVVVWKTTPGTGAWTEDVRVHLPSICEVGLERPELPFGGIAPGATSDALTQTVISNGTIPIDTLEIWADPWVTASGGMALPAGATEARSAYAGPRAAAAAAGEWVNLATATTMGEPGGDTLPWLHPVEFRVSAPADVPQGAAGPITQTITYAAECLDPYG